MKKIQIFLRNFLSDSSQAFSLQVTPLHYKKAIALLQNLECISQIHQTDPGGKLLSSKVEICLRDLALKTFKLGNVYLL